MQVEVKSWLKAVFNEKIDDFSLKIVGSSEKGDGYLGDIVFVSLTPVTGIQSKEYNLVMKCSKRSEVLRETTPVKEVFINEMYVYNSVFPTFSQFQLEKGISEPFNSRPKCYGTLTTEDMEIIVLENMKKSGYSLWGKERPWTRKHIDLVMKEYANFHSISIAMKDQQPKKFNELCENLIISFKEFVEKTDLVRSFEASVGEVCDLLKGGPDENILKLYKPFKEKTRYILCDMADECCELKVITHGDCWCNNFMFKNGVEKENLPAKVAILDWQVARYSSPIYDLSYFLFAGISEEDIKDLNNILDNYYHDLKTFTANLGSNLNTLYPKQQFWIDWKKYCKFGILMSNLVHKMCATDKSEVIDVTEAAEHGGDLGAAFTYEVKNKTAFKNRARHVVKYVVENGLTD